MSTKPLRFWIVNLDFPPIGGPGVWRALALAKYGGCAGHAVTVYCSDRSSWHARRDETLLQQLNENVTVVRISSLFLSDIKRNITSNAGTSRKAWRNSIARFINWQLDKYWPDPAFHWGAKVAFQILRDAKTRPPDCIFTTGPSHLSHFSGYLLTRRFGVPWVMDYRDPWTGFDGDNQISSLSYQKGLFGWCERKLIAKASRVTVVSPTWRRFLISLIRDSSANAEKIMLVRNGHDLPDNLNSLFSSAYEPPHESFFRIHFNGSVQPNNNILGTLKLVLKHLHDAGLTKEDLRFSFCGLPPTFLTDSEGFSGSDLVEDFGALSHEDSLRKSVSAACLMVIVRDQGELAQGTIPAKVYEAIALNKHIFAVVPSPSDIVDLLSEYGKCTIVPPDRAEILTDAVMALLRKHRADASVFQSDYTRLGNRISARYSRKCQIQQLLQLFEEVASNACERG